MLPMLMLESEPLEYILLFLMLQFLDLYIHVVLLSFHLYMLLLIQIDYQQNQIELILQYLN